MLGELTVEPTGQTALVIIVGAICTVLTILLRDGGPMLYKLWSESGKQVNIREKIRKEGHEAVITWLENRVDELEKHSDSQDECIDQLQAENRDCFVKTARLETELGYAKKEVADLQAWKARRGGSDVLVAPEKKE